VLIVITAILFLNFPAINMVFRIKEARHSQFLAETHYLIDTSYHYLVGQLTTKDVLVTDVLQNV